MSDGIPSSLSANDVRRIADQLEILNQNFVKYIDLERKKATGEIQKKGYHGEKKAPEVWLACSLECIRLSETEPLIGWEQVKELTAIRDPDKGNMTRPIQWRRFVRQHLIPRTPDYGGEVRFVGLGKEDKEGFAVVATEKNLHCAKRAFEGTEYNQYQAFDKDCGFCAAKKVREKGEHIANAKMRLDRATENLKRPGISVGVRESYEKDAERAKRDLELLSQLG